MSPSSGTSVAIGVGFDTARYGHHVSFLRADRLPAAKDFTFADSHAGYEQLRQALEGLQQRHGVVHFHMRIDAAGNYAANLERFLRSLPFEKTISIGEPKRNRDYCKVHFPKRKSDSVEAEACARFALVELPPATANTPAAFTQLRELAGALESQVKRKTCLLNQLHNRLARVFPELAVQVPELSAAWVLKLLWRYPSPAKIAGARLSSLMAIPHLTEAKAQKLQAAARQTVASLQGPLIEELIRQSISAVRQSQKSVRNFKRLLVEAYDALPASPHRQIETIPGIGKQTAAALVAKIVDLNRFATPERLINYFGVFPEENTSGVDKFGRPVPAGTQRMSFKGNDLVRSYLWNAAKTAILHNPVIRTLYARKRAQGKRGDVTLGHCMQKLLRLVFAVWKTDCPFTTPVLPNTEDSAPGEREEAVGRKGRSPLRQAVTTAPFSVPAQATPGNSPLPQCRLPQSAAAQLAAEPIDFAQVRRHVTIEQVLQELGWWHCLRGTASQRRGPCPIHGTVDGTNRCFSVNLRKNIFQCFHAACAAKGNVLDLWAQRHRLPLPAAARDLAQRFALPAEQRRGTRNGTRSSISGDKV
jgi:transposase